MIHEIFLNKNIKDVMSIEQLAVALKATGIQVEVNDMSLDAKSSCYESEMTEISSGERTYCHRRLTVKTEDGLKQEESTTGEFNPVFPRFVMGCHSGPMTNEMWFTILLSEEEDSFLLSEDEFNYLDYLCGFRLSSFLDSKFENWDWIFEQDQVQECHCYD